MKGCAVNRSAWARSHIYSVAPKSSPQSSPTRLSLLQRSRSMTKTRKRSKTTSGSPQSLLNFLTTTSNDIKVILENPAVKRKKDVQSGKFLHKNLKNSHKSCSELRYRPYGKATKAAEQTHDSEAYMNDSVRALFSDISRYTEMINEDHVKNTMQTRNLTQYYTTPQHNMYATEEAVTHPDRMFNPVEPRVPYVDPIHCPTYHEAATPMTPWELEPEHTTLADIGDFDGLLSYLSDDSLDSTNSSDLEPDYSLFQ